MAQSEKEYFAELVGLLQDKKANVQRLAAEGLLECTESIEFIEYCKCNPRAVARSFIRLAERAEAAAAKGGEAAEETKKDRAAEMERLELVAGGAAALKALVNLSAAPEVSAELVDMNACRRCCEAMKAGWLEGRSDLAHWYSMLLANMSSAEAGQKALCAEEGHLRFLFAAFVSKARPPPRDGYDDPMLCLGKVINNVCALREGRVVFAEGDAGASTVGILVAELGDRQRRLDVLSTFRNLCVDEECHDAIVSTDFLARLSLFLYPWTKADSERRKDLPETLQEVLESDGAALTGDAIVRHTAAQSLKGLCQSAKGRAYLREAGCSEILRAWLTEEADDDTRQIIEMTAALVNESEDDSGKASDSQAAADAASQRADD
jgi:hypothetical protein